MYAIGMRGHRYIALRLPKVQFSFKPEIFQRAKCSEHRLAAEFLVGSGGG